MHDGELLQRGGMLRGAGEEKQEEHGTGSRAGSAGGVEDDRKPACLDEKIIQEWRLAKANTQDGLCLSVYLRGERGRQRGRERAPAGSLWENVGRPRELRRGGGTARAKTTGQATGGRVFRGRLGGVQRRVSGGLLCWRWGADALVARWAPGGPWDWETPVHRESCLERRGELSG